MSQLEILIEHVWVPFDAHTAATWATYTGELITRRIRMTPQEILEEFGDHLSTEEINLLKSRI